MTMIDDLRAAGIHVDRAIEVRELPDRYRDAVPIIASWLTHIDKPNVAGGAVQTLTSSWAKPAYNDLVDALFVYTARARATTGMESTEWEETAWAAANAIDSVWNDSRFDELADYVRNLDNGKPRGILLYGMRKSKRPEAREIAADLLGETRVSSDALSVLARHPVERARPKIEKWLADNPKDKKAQRALARLNEAAAKGEV